MSKKLLIAIIIVVVLAVAIATYYFTYLAQPKELQHL